MVEVDSELGPFLVNLPIGTARHLRTGEIIRCGGLVDRICSHAIKSSYRTACDSLNQDLHRYEANCPIPLMTFTDIAVREGLRIEKETKRHTEEVLLKFGFTKDGLWPEGKELPMEIRNHETEFITIDPDIIMSNAGLKPPSPITLAENEHSKPLTGLHLRTYKRRTSRILVPDEHRESYLEDYVLYVNSQENRDPYSIIRHPCRIERCTDDIVNIFIDAVVVPDQASHRSVNTSVEKETDLKSDGNDDQYQLKSYDIRIETEDGGRYNITSTSMEQAYLTLLAFLLETGLITKYLIFYIDGEKKLKTAIDKYFVHWHHQSFLDDYHINEKVDKLTSMGIKSKRVPSPWEPPILYLRGEKAGQIRFQPMTSLSRTYGEIIKTAIFYGNVEEAKEYIRHIPAEDIEKQKYLDEMIGYLDSRADMLTCYAIRKRGGLKNSSNASELCNELVISSRQKVDDRMSWCERGSGALAAVTCLYLNQGAEQWFRTNTVSFKLYYVKPTKLRHISQKESA